MLHIQGGTIHPPDKSGGILYPSTPRYKSTIDCLNFFYPRINKGGIILIHDYVHSKGVTRAVNDFFEDKPEQITQIYNQCRIIKL